MTAEPNLTRSGRRAFCVRSTRRNTDRRSGLAVVAAIGVALVATGCAPTQSGKGSIAERPTVQRPADPGVVAINGVRYVARTDRDSVQVGDATWYGPGFHGRKTASGERFDSGLVTAAHRSLPMPSLVKVTNLDNGRTLIVRINDRGPFVRSKIIDMSARGAELLGFRGSGSARVKIQVLEEETRYQALQLQRQQARRSQVASAGGPADVGDVPYIAVPPAPALPARMPEIVGRAEDEGKPTGLFVAAAKVTRPQQVATLSEALRRFGPVSTAAGSGAIELRIGPFIDPKAASSALKQIADAGYPGARIVAE
ncbi:MULTISPECIES: septal ring lytic transglycosylase RlpA family protein [Inquilinus]|uniref:Endolytic peptidoglycan transglycosylase RlpA n=1 Tax=Inquilinus ginsengisoli TaxID=363840 RepID=A0ABU1JW87_9PROT|nr:septal ring lytic transglycosylase RlpA family protein [Inquilinus ginsengisoli]MDR6292892.1 rare lipoprotein A [Inquilinus ginsengisoli]